MSRKVNFSSIMKTLNEGLVSDWRTIAKSMFYIISHAEGHNYHNAFEIILNYFEKASKRPFMNREIINGLERIGSFYISNLYNVDKPIHSFFSGEELHLIEWYNNHISVTGNKRLFIDFDVIFNSVWCSQELSVPNFLDYIPTSLLGFSCEQAVSKRYLNKYQYFYLLSVAVKTGTYSLAPNIHYCPLFSDLQIFMKNESLLPPRSYAKYKNISCNKGYFDSYLIFQDKNVDNRFIYFPRLEDDKTPSRPRINPQTQRPLNLWKEIGETFGLKTVINLSGCLKGYKGYLFEDFIICDCGITGNAVYAFTSETFGHLQHWNKKDLIMNEPKGFIFREIHPEKLDSLWVTDIFEKATSNITAKGCINKSYI